MNNTEYSYNKETCVIFQKQEDQGLKKSFVKRQIKNWRKAEFKRYNRFFENEMNKTVQNNNREIYQNCIHFIKQHCIKFFSKDVPCNVVITNCESSSNNETQFNSLFEALKKEQILNFVIDEKKCGTTKNMISYIQKAVQECVGEASIEGKNKIGGDHSDEEIKVIVSSDESSSENNDEPESEDEMEENSRFKSISPPKRPTVDEQSVHVHDNAEIDQQYDRRRTTESDMSRKMPTNIKKQYKGELIKNETNGDEELRDNNGIDHQEESKIDTSATDKIGFSGIKKIIRKANWKSPIVIVIQNIKTFPTDNLNDLIYLVKKYRAKYGLKLCLMMGVQSNSYEDLMSKISITTSNFMIVKKFYFPSMKKILLEVIYRLLKSERNIYLFGQDFLKSVIENIQVYGLSLEKFKRIMHYLLASCFNDNEYFYVNALINQECDKINNDSLIDGSEDNFYFQELITMFAKSNKLLDELDNCVKLTKQHLRYEDSGLTENELKTRLCAFYSKKMKYFKAYEVIEEICVNNIDKDSLSNAPVFKHCFLLNLFSCKDFSEKYNVIYDEFKNTPNFEELIMDNILPVLKSKTSKFLKENYSYLKDKVESEVDLLKDLASKGQSNKGKRMNQMMNAVDKENKGFVPKTKNNDDYHMILKDWLREYIVNYLCLTFDKHDKNLFILNSKNITERISPDIQGLMTKSLMFSGTILHEYGMKILKLKNKEIPEYSDEDKKEMLTKCEQDTTKLMEGYKYYGKDIDVNEWFKTFKDQIKFEEDVDKFDKYEERRITERFLKALGDLKYIGYISESGRGTYIFKRNYFGKNIISF